MSFASGLLGKRRLRYAFGGPTADELGDGRRRCATGLVGNDRQESALEAEPRIGFEYLVYRCLWQVFEPGTGDIHACIETHQRDFWLFLFGGCDEVERNRLVYNCRPVGRIAVREEKPYRWFQNFGVRCIMALSRLKESEHRHEPVTARTREAHAPRWLGSHSLRTSNTA